ncbi:MAG: radical SAM protein [Clostridia bacterium]|nr:radical SAM protein [Clostridia bacterium]
MKNIYFVQPNDVYKGKVPSTYIPYASGCIIAYCKQNKAIAENFDFKKIIYSRVPIEKLIAGLEQPYAVLFSCSVWNTEYDKKAAQAVKSAYPDCKIIFGGHNVSADGSFLQQYPYIDFLTHRFGEETTEGLLEHFLGLRELRNIDNISYRDGNKVITTDYVTQTTIDFPSPYLTGVFDDLLNDGVNFSAVFETNRGCPNRCSYCDWGELKTKVRLFPMERVKAEIDWFAAHKIEFIYAADANFGLFSRDVEIAKYVVESKKKYGYPQVFRVCFTKNKLDVVFQIGAMFFEYDLDKAQTISFQSMDATTLENVGRKNISPESFKRLMKQYNDIDIATHSELILGLPGETYDSFCEGIGTLLENGQHYSFIVYPCMLLPNSEMGQPWYLEKYKIKSTSIPFQIVHTEIGANQDDITEYGRYTTETYSMNREEWVRSLIYSKYAQALHSLGLLKNVALFYRYEYDVSFASFYKMIIEFSRREDMPLLHCVYSNIHALCHKIAKAQSGFLTTCKGLGKILWEFDEVIYLEFFKDLEQFYREIKQCLAERFGTCDEVDALFCYQFDVIKKIGVETVTVSSAYDFYHYFNNILSYDYTPLEKKALRFTVHDAAPVADLSEYARKVIWYGRNKRLTDYTSSFYRSATVFDTQA